MTKNSDYDSPWKDILRQFFQPFVEFCLPEAAKAIDWTRGYESLDKELIALAPDHAIGKRIADKLYKVWRKEGDELFLLFHLEVQAQKEAKFPERMYVYHYRLFDRYKKSVVSVAILADDNPHWRPSSYEQVSYYTELRFNFAAIKLLDYAAEPAVLERSANPFAIVILAHIKALQTKTQAEQRLQSKLAVTRALYERGFSKEYILALFRFIDWVMVLPPNFELEYVKELELFERGKKMQYVTSVERIGIEKGKVIGMDLGIQKGIDLGMTRGERTLLKRQLLRRFGELPPEYEVLLNEASEKQLLAWSDRLFDAKTLADCFKLD